MYFSIFLLYTRYFSWYFSFKIARYSFKILSFSVLLNILSFKNKINVFYKISRNLLKMHKIYWKFNQIIHFYVSNAICQRNLRETLRHCDFIFLLIFVFFSELCFFDVLIDELLGFSNVDFFQEEQFIFASVFVKFLNCDNFFLCII